VVSQLIEAAGLAFAITAMITFAVVQHHAATGGDRRDDPARLPGNEIGSTVIQTFAGDRGAGRAVR
jgi:hypothetical protein